MAYIMYPQDTPFLMFSAFTGENKIDHLNLLLLIERMTEYHEAVAYSYYMERAIETGIIGEKTTQENINNYIRRLSTLKLVRRQVVYNDEKKDWENSLLLTGYGRKFLDFIRDLSQEDLDEARDYQITNVRRIMRDLASRTPLPENRADLLTAAFTNLRSLIYHLSGFNAEFTDFVDRNGKAKIQTAQEAREWISQIMGSKYLLEYYSICDDSLGYVSQISEIALCAEKIIGDEGLTELIIRDRQKKADLLREKKNMTDLSADEIDKQVRSQLQRIYSISSTEYRMYIMRITKAVNSIVSRIHLVFSAFGAEIGGDNLRTRIMKLLRYVEKTEDCTVLDNIMNLYDERCYTEESFAKKAVRSEEEKKYPDPVYLFDSGTKRASPIVTRRMRTKAHMEKVLEGNDRVKLRSLPLENDEDFYRIVRLVYLAAANENEAKEYATQHIEGEGASYHKGPYTIPNIYIVRRKKDGKLLRTEPAPV